ncbi:hypothetical protein MASR2M15_20390 [Anaerolineales bacterium]
MIPSNTLLLKILLCIIGLLSLTACNLSNNIKVSPVATADIPKVEILAPANNALVYENTDFPIDIIARDQSSGITKVEMYVDGELVNEASPDGKISVPVFRVEMNWLARGLGKHVLSFISYRLDGTRSDESLINIDVVTRP